MRLSTRGRYAVMAMADLAIHAHGNPVRLGEIAERQNLSLSYLEQLFRHLRKSGVVKSIKGPGGGYLLSRPSSEIRISDIIFSIFHLLLIGIILDRILLFEAFKDIANLYL